MSKSTTSSSASEQGISPDKSFWDKFDWNGGIPEEYRSKAEKLRVVEGMQEVQLNQENELLHETEIFYRECRPTSDPKLDVLFLHGASFSSKTWQDLGTLQLVAAMGYSATAIDLPGFGKTKGPSLQGKDASTLIESFCRTRGILNDINLVIVAASMSGNYAIPYVMFHPRDNSALLAVAPMGSDKFSKEQYRKVQIPLLNVYGSRDSALGENINTHFSQAPQASSRIIENAGHAAYMNQPEEWHRILYLFLLQVGQWYKDKTKEENFDIEPVVE